jgi:large-conductance mechanosensitive channel
LQDQFSEGVDRLRQTAKWIIAVFAAIGATLTAGTQLSNLGQFGLKDWRLWVAVIAAVVAFLAIGGVIWFAVKVLIGGRTSIDDLAKEEQEDPDSANMTFVKAHLQLLAGVDKVETLRNEYMETITKREEAGRNNEQQKFRQLSSRLVYLQEVIHDLLLALRYDKVYRLFEKASKSMLLLGFIAAFAILIFVWAANPPTTPTAKRSASTTVTTSLSVTD